MSDSGVDRDLMISEDRHSPVPVVDPPPDFELFPAQWKGRLDWQKVFGNRNPVEVEIGTGKGKFLIEAARNHVEINYLGVEWSRKWLRFAKGRIQRAGLRNVRLVRSEAFHLLTTYFPENSVSALHVYFPDPWPKRRHARRRLIRPETAECLARCLIPAGTLVVATDRFDFHREILKVFRSGEPLRLQWSRETSGDSLPRTHFEAKYLAEGRRIYTAEFRKT